MPVVPATQEAEAGESLDPGGRGCNEPRLHPAPLHSSLGNRMRLCLEKTNKEKTGSNQVHASFLCFQLYVPSLLNTQPHHVYFMLISAS